MTFSHFTTQRRNLSCKIMDYLTVKQKIKKEITEKLLIPMDNSSRFEYY